MKLSSLSKIIVAFVASATIFEASANSVGLENVEYDGGSNQISITLTYDFTDFAMFGGGLDIVYDPNAIEFVSYTQAPLSPDAQANASPIGALDSPGLYSGVGIGTFDFFTGMTSAGDIGVFVFHILDLGSAADSTPCGLPLCLTRNAINPFVSLAGADVTDEVIANGMNLSGVPIPVPAAAWLLLSGLGALLGFSRNG